MSLHIALSHRYDFCEIFFVLSVPGISLHSTVCNSFIYLLWHLVFSFSHLFFVLYISFFFEWEVCHAFKSKYGRVLTVKFQIRAESVFYSFANYYYSNSTKSSFHHAHLAQIQMYLLMVKMRRFDRSNDKVINEVAFS